MRDSLIEMVRARRRRLGWTQAELAKCLGSSPSRVCKVEAGEPSVSLGLVVRALEAMGVPVAVHVDPDLDPIEDPKLSPQSRIALARRLFHRRYAERIAERHGVDGDDVYHVLHNLELSHEQRLRSAFRRARLRRRSTHRG
jgi:transcriptional regulator with XRE-family HTH domain